MTLVINNPYAPRYFQVWTLVSPCVCSSPYLTGLLNAQRTLRHYDNQGKDGNATEQLTLTICCPISHTERLFFHFLGIFCLYCMCCKHICFSEFFYILGTGALYTLKPDPIHFCSHSQRKKTP